MMGGINTYWWMANPVVPVSQSGGLPRIDIGGIFKLTTNAVALSASTVDYGINPCLYNRLPNESIVLLTIHADVPTGGENFPVNLVVPNSGNSTVNLNNTTSGTTKLNIVDSLSNNVTGSNVQGNSQRFVYINKCTGTVRFMEFTNAAAAASTSNG